MSEPLVSKPEAQNGASFSEMARAIDHNAGQGFGGAAVIIPPTGGGAGIELLILDSQGDVAQFWSTVKTRIDIRLMEIDQQQRALRR